MKILFLSYWYPFPPSNGSKIRIYNLLRILAASHETVLVTFVDDSNEFPHLEPLKTICSEVVVIPRKNYNPASLRSLVGFFSPSPRVFIDTYSAEMVSCIQQLIAKRNFDFVIASQVGTAVYRDCFRELPAIFEEVEVGVPYEQYAFSKSLRQRVRSGLTWWKHKNFLQRKLNEFDYCTVASERERYLLSHTVPAYNKIEILPNFVDLKDYHDVSEVTVRDMIIFSGSFRYLPNYHGIKWFLTDVSAYLESEFPNLRLYVTGDRAGISLQKYHHVIQTGFIDNIHNLIAKAWLQIVPLRVGGGTRLKIIESMALGTPVVSTSKGAEGLDVTHGKNILIADDPKAFAHAVRSVLKNADLRQSLSVEGRKLIAEKYSSDVIAQKLTSLLGKILERSINDQ